MDNQEEHFSGDASSLKAYWEVEERAVKFKQPATRKIAIQFLIDRIETDVHSGIWLDTAIGAGYVQTQLSPSVEAAMLIGLDFSRTMLQQIEDDSVHKVLGTVFSLPFRNDAISVTSNIFCLSDYPKIDDALHEMFRCTKTSGMVIFLDYASSDGYWTRRKEQHGNHDDKGDMIVGNIHLRTLDEIKSIAPKQVRVILDQLLVYEVPSKDMITKVELPKDIQREFLYVEWYIPRSAKA